MARPRLLALFKSREFRPKIPVLEVNPQVRTILWIHTNLSEIHVIPNPICGLYLKIHIHRQNSCSLSRPLTSTPTQLS